MINTTEHPIILCDDLPEAVESAFEAYADYVSRKYGERELVDRQHYSRYFPIEMFCGGNLVKSEVDEEFAKAACKIACGDAKTFGTLKEVLYKATKSERHIAMGRSLNSLRGAIRLALFVMWSRKQVLLPISYKFQNVIDERELMCHGPKLFCHFLSYKKTHPLNPQLSCIRRAMVCTNWYEPETLTITEVADFKLFLNSVRLRKEDVSGTHLAFCMRTLMVEALKHFPDRVSYNEESIKNWDLFCASGRNRNAWEENENYGYLKTLAYKSASERLDSGYFPDLSTFSFLSSKLPQKAIKTWTGLFDEYRAYRMDVKGIETEKGVINALRELADYMGQCLPIIYYVNQEPEGEILSCPKEFTRIPYMSKHGRISGIPTLQDYIQKRHSGSPEGQYSVLNNIYMFFEYVERSYADDDCNDIAGPDFKNPIWKEMDLPRQPGKARRSTNKKPFAKHVLAHLLRWMYAVESFGMFLQDNHIKLPRSLGGRINTAEYGFVPEYEHLGCTYQVKEIPASIVYPAKNQSRTSLSVLRMIMLALETGIRLQSSQWLCKKQWDKFNTPEKDKDAYILYVNTDKCGSPFTRPILKRVRELLLREQYDQSCYNLPDKEILYEGRANTRFEPLVPLFRNINTGRPYSDSSYYGAWLKILERFQKHYQENVGNVLFVTVKKPRKVIIRYTEDEQNPYCEVKLVPIYTPHSCRSTFINNYSMFIDLGDVAELVGHADQVATSHYLSADSNELADKLIHADSALMAEEGDHATIKDGPAFIKAQGTNSALAQSFRKDRNETINAFGMVSLQRVLDEKEDKKGITAIDRLKASPMSQIVFRPTHICPVGEQCPEEVLKVTGAARRCGLCPLACRSVDHLPAIGVKKNELLERIRSSKQAYNRLEKYGEMDALSEIWDAMEADTQEFLAWSLTEDVLWEMSKQLKKDEIQYHTIEPDLVRKHLERVVKKTSPQEFILKRIIESNEYPTMQTDRIRIFADRIKRTILVNPEDSLGVFNDPSDSISDVASFIKTAMRTRNFTLEDLSKELERPLSKPSLRPMIGLSLEDPKSD